MKKLFLIVMVILAVSSLYAADWIAQESHNYEIVTIKSYEASYDGELVITNGEFVIVLENNIARLYVKPEYTYKVNDYIIEHFTEILFTGHNGDWWQIHTHIAKE